MALKLQEESSSDSDGPVPKANPLVKSFDNDGDDSDDGKKKKKSKGQFFFLYMGEKKSQLSKGFYFSACLVCLCLSACLFRLCQ